MEGQVTHILGIAPYDGMQTAMERVAEEFPNIQLDAYTGDLEAGAAIVRSAQLEHYDVIISRGGTADRIREVTDLPVISIQLSVYDVLRAIKMAENYSNLYAIVGFPSITEPAHTLCDLLRLDMDIITIHSMEETNRALDRLREGGYKMVVSDMVTHTLARQKGFDAFLITSGVESLHDAFTQAVQISDRFRQMRRQNQLLEGVARTRSGNTIVLDQDGQLVYAAKEQPGPKLLELLRARLPDVPPASPLRFFHTEGGEFTRVTAHRLRAGWEQYYTFHCQQSQIPLRSSKNGLRFFDEAEAMQQFMHSFYSISGAMGMLEEQVNAIAPTRQPVMILGEVGTGKEQIARALYLRSPRVNSPFVVVDCSLMTDKNWEYLFNHYASPLNEGSCTVYFQHLELLSHAPARAGAGAAQPAGLPDPAAAHPAGPPGRAAQPGQPLPQQPERRTWQADHRVRSPRLRAAAAIRVAQQLHPVQAGAAGAGHPDRLGLYPGQRGGRGAGAGAAHLPFRPAGRPDSRRRGDRHPGRHRPAGHPPDPGRRGRQPDCRRQASGHQPHDPVAVSEPPGAEKGISRYEAASSSRLRAASSRDMAVVVRLR